MTSQPKRLFAVVPAAGRSRRMGRPKLLLPLGEQSVIECLLEALGGGVVTDTVVVVREDDDALKKRLAERPARVVCPEHPPADMRASVQIALDELQRRHSPTSADAWLLVPADHPVLDASIVQTLASAARKSSQQIIVPRYFGRRGHPTIFPWELAAAVPDIPANQGLNWLMHQYKDRVLEIDVESPGVLVDLDTPGDYERIRQQWNEQNRGGSCATNG